LDVHSNATQEEIRAAYKRRACEFHPDKNTVDTTRIFQAVKLAYNVLCNETQRTEYDEDVDVDKDDDGDEIFSTIKDGHTR
jgi:curved DNA-binding protein CbpA